MGVLNKEIRITAVDAGFTTTIDRLSDDAKKKLEKSDPGLSELLNEAQAKFTDIGEQVRYIAEEINRLIIPRSTFQNERGDIRSEYEPHIQKAVSESNLSEHARLIRERDKKLKQVDEDETKQIEENKRLAASMDRLREVIERDAKNQERKPIDQIEHEDKQQRKWLDFFESDNKEKTKEQLAQDMLHNHSLGQRVGGMVTQATGNSAIGQTIASGIAETGTIASIIALVTGAVFAGNELTNKSARAMGMSGYNVDDFDRKESESQNRFSNSNAAGGNLMSSAFGLSAAEYIERLPAIMQAQGRRDVADIALHQLGLERAYGLESGRLSKTDVFSRADNTVQNSTAQIELFMQEAKKLDLFNMGKSGGNDMTQLQEKIGIFERLVSAQASRQEIIDQRQSMRMIEMGGEVGGSFGDNRAGERLSSLDAAITNPQGGFREAYIWNQLHKANPNMDVFEIEKLKSQGLYGEGNLKALLGGVHPMGKSKEAMDDYYMRIERLTHLSPEAAEKLGSAIQRDPTLLDRYSKKDPDALQHMEKLVDEKGRDLAQRSADNTGNITSLWAETKSTFQGIGHKIDGISDFMKTKWGGPSNKAGQDNKTRQPTSIHPLGHQ